jgi:UDP-N-acetylmuramate--alanine ligase
MNVYFSGIGGTGIGPLAIIAAQAGYKVFGSDKQESEYTRYLRNHGVTEFHIGQEASQIAGCNNTYPIDWFVYSSALPKENPNHPEIIFCQQNNIKVTKRDEFLVELLKDKNLYILAVAGTHGKTTTTAMWVWLLKQLGVPISYSLGAKTSFADMGCYDPKSKYFVYECDEYDRNFLSFFPYISIITGISWDHADIYPTSNDYDVAFSTFVKQSRHVVGWRDDYAKINAIKQDNNHLLSKNQATDIDLIGLVNRQNALEVIKATKQLIKLDPDIMRLCTAKLGATNNEIIIPPNIDSDTFVQNNDQIDILLGEILEQFPGVSRRFERLASNIYTDYAHTAEKIAGAINIAKESSANVVVVYEGLHNRRQHFMLEQNQLKGLFDGVKHLYWVPSYLAREDPNQELLTPPQLIELANYTSIAESANLNDGLLAKIRQHSTNNDLVLCISAGGGGSLDEWLRRSILVN